MKKLRSVLLLGTGLGLGYGAAWVRNLKKRELDVADSSPDVYRLNCYYDLQTQWIKNLQAGKSIAEYFEANQYKNIAIYGKGRIGIALYQELKGTGIHVEYFTDTFVEDKTLVENDVYVVPLKSLAKEKKVDAIVVTPTFDFERIKKELSLIVKNVQIANLRDVVYFGDSNL